MRHKLYYVSASVLFSAVAFFMYDWIAALNPNAEWAQAYPSVAGLYVDIPWSRDLASGEEIEGCLVTIAMANAEGWATKAGSKWKTMPEQMLRYRAASWLVRAFAPELTMGLSTVEESEDVGEIDQRPAPRRASTILTSITGPAPALAPENAESAPAPAAEPEPPAYQQIGDEPE